MFKKTNKKKGKYGRKLRAGLISIDSFSLRSKFSPKDDENGSSSSQIDHKGKTILSASKPPLPPSSVQHLRYRNAYNHHAADEESVKGSVVSGDDSIYKLMMQELKEDFSDSKHSPLRFVPAQTVVRSNKTKAGQGYEEALDDTLRVLDAKPGPSQEMEGRDSLSIGRQDEAAEMRDGFNAPYGPDMIDGTIQMNLVHSAEEDNEKMAGPLSPAFEAQLDCVSDEAQTGPSDSSVAERSVRSSMSARSSTSARSGRSARSNRSVQSGRSAGNRLTGDSELVSLRELSGKRRHRKQKSELEPSSSSSDDGTEYIGRRKQTLRKLSKRDRVPADGRSYYSEASGGTFDETTLGGTEYEWDNIDSFDSWLSLENELRYGAKDDWFCGACFRR